MGLFKDFFDVNQENLYTTAEGFLQKRGDFRITQRTKNTSLYAEGSKNINEIGVGVGLVLGILFLFLFFPLGIIIFIVVGVIYAASPNNSIHMDIQSEGGGRSSISITSQGKDATNVTEIIARKLNESLKERTDELPSGT